jgi:hypothetical protein
MQLEGRASNRSKTRYLALVLLRWRVYVGAVLYITTKIFHFFRASAEWSGRVFLCRLLPRELH